MTQLGKNYVSYLGTLQESFDIFADWTPSGTGSIAAETTNIKEGVAALKINSINSSNNQQAIKIISKDLSKANVFWLLLFPATNATSIALGFTSDTGFATKHFSVTKTIVTSKLNRWNLIRILKSDFTNTGSEDWANTMIRMRVRCVSNNASESAYAIFDELRTEMYVRPKVLLTCDNVGNQTSMMTYMYPIMRKYGLKGTLYVQSGAVGGEGCMTLEDLKTLYNYGWDMGNHSTTHPDLTTLTETQITTEIATADSFLGNNGFVKGRRHFAYPYGATNNLVISVLQKYCDTGRITDTKIEVQPPPHPHRFSCHSLEPATTVDDVKTIIANTIAQGGVVNLMWEGIATSSPPAGYWLNTDFEILMQYLARLNGIVLDVVPLSEWYKGLTQPRKDA